MKLSEIFTRAKQEIADGYETYICLAIRFDSGIPRLDRHRALDVIYERIHGKQRVDADSSGWSVQHWLLQHNHAKMKDCTWQNLQEYRLRWLDALIKEFKKKGD